MSQNNAKNALKYPSQTTLRVFTFTPGMIALGQIDVKISVFILKKTLE